MNAFIIFVLGDNQTSQNKVSPDLLTFTRSVIIIWKYVIKFYQTDIIIHMFIVISVK